MSMSPDTLDAANKARVEPATMEDLPQLVQLLADLFEMEGDFEPNSDKQERGLRLILEQPQRGRIFVLRNDDTAIGMVSLLFTISTAAGGMAIVLEDLIIHPAHRHQGYGTILIDAVREFAKAKDFKRITLLTDKVSEESQRFFSQHGFQPSHMIPMRMLLDASSESES